MNHREISFTDRERFINLIRTEYDNQCRTTSYFKIISWYGMGGIGKTRLLSEIRTIIETEFLPHDRNIKLIFLKLEIAQSDNLLNALVHIRSQVGHPCPLFDYALLNYWNRVQISKFNEDFLKSLKTEWFQFFITAGEFVSFPLSTLSEFLSLPLDTLLGGIKGTYLVLKNKYHERRYSCDINTIQRLSTSELQQCLGGFLGMELNRLFHTKHLIVIVDAYEKFDSSNFVDWLGTLISETYTGIFIVSSREKIFDGSKNFSPEILKNEQLEHLPPEEARILLQRELPSVSDSIIEHLIDITDCVPIYLDLAVNTYRNRWKQGQDCQTPAAFMLHDKNDLVRQFFHHLKDGEQHFMMILSLVQLFNQDIFEYFAEHLHEISPFAYDKIRSLSLVSNVETDSNFYKIHDAITANVRILLEPSERYGIFQMYLRFIHNKLILLSSGTQKIILYKHLLNMVIQNRFELGETETEQLLDIFFDLKQTMSDVDFSGVKGFSQYKPLQDFYYFTLAVYCERRDTLVRLTWLNHISETDCRFGKHKKSLTIIRGYLNEWCGDHSSMKMALEHVEPALQDIEIREWYYAQAKIFRGDYLTITGDFKKAERILKQFLQDIQKFPEQTNSIFQAKRHLGHLYRFNLMSEKANHCYLSTRDEHEKYGTAIQEIYIVTNLCETNCFLHPEIVLENCYHGLELGKSLHDLKSIAKIYYAMAIAQLHYKKYKRARKYIQKSLRYNQIDGYRLGMLFPLLAEVFLCQCCRHPLNTTSLERLLVQVQVYGFLKLPIAILKQDMGSLQEIQRQYQWLNFRETVAGYRSFFGKIGISTIS